MTTEQLSIESAFLREKMINGTIDFDQTMNVLSTLGIYESMSYIEKVFCELDGDDQSDEESVGLTNSDKAKAFDKLVLLAQTKESVTLDDVNALIKEITGNQ